VARHTPSKLRKSLGTETTTGPRLFKRRKYCNANSHASQCGVFLSLILPRRITSYAAPNSRLQFTCGICEGRRCRAASNRFSSACVRASHLFSPGCGIAGMGWKASRSSRRDQTSFAQRSMTACQQFSRSRTSQSGSIRPLSLKKLRH
jgi:hypothetical protein